MWNRLSTERALTIVAGYYPLLIALYRHLGLRLVPTFFTFSFSRLPGSTYFIYSGASGLSVPSLPSSSFLSPIAFIRSILHFVGTAICFLIWMGLAFLSWWDILPRPLARDNSLREFTDHVAAFLASPLPLVRTPLGGVWSRFIEEVIIPLFGAVGTMTSDDIWETPVGCLLEYVHTTIGTAHYTLSPGTGATEVANRLAEEVRAQGPGHLRLGEVITGLEYRDGKVVVQCSGSEEVIVDRVVVATQASSARVLLGMLEQSLREQGESTEESTERKRIKKMLRGLDDVEYRVSRFRADGHEA
jgi:hypothetical protein